MAATIAGTDSGTVLAALELSRNLSIQRAALGTLEFVVAFAVFSADYRASTGTMPAFGFAPGGVAWWNQGLDLLVLAVLATLVVVLLSPLVVLTLVGVATMVVFEWGGSCSPSPRTLPVRSAACGWR